MPAQYIPLIGGGLAVTVGAATIAVAMRRDTRRVLIERRLSRFTAESGPSMPAARRRGGLRLAAPFVRLGRSLLAKPADRDKLVRQLMGAGLEHPDGAYLFAGFRLIAALVAFVVTAAVYWGHPLGAIIALAYGVGAGGSMYVLPGRILSFIAGRRAQAIRRELPFALDLIQLALGGGSSIEQAMRFCAMLDPNPAPRVRDVVRALLEDLGRGMSYEAALDRWGRRLAIEEGAELSEMFRQSLLHGAELSPGLRVLVIEFTDRRLTQAREAIGRKSTKLTMVMVGFFLPVLILLLGAPAVVAILKGLGAFVRP